MLPVKHSVYASALMDAMDELAGWEVIPVDELRRVSAYVSESLDVCTPPRSTKTVIFKAYESVLVAKTTLQAGANGCFPVRGAVGFASVHLSNALSIIVNG